LQDSPELYAGRCPRSIQAEPPDVALVETPHQIEAAPVSARAREQIGRARRRLEELARCLPAQVVEVDGPRVHVEQERPAGEPHRVSAAAGQLREAAGRERVE